MLTRRLLVTFIWLSLLAATGIVNIIAHPGIFRAFDPSRAILRKLSSSFIVTATYSSLPQSSFAPETTTSSLEFSSQSLDAKLCLPSKWCASMFFLEIVVQLYHTAWVNSTRCLFRYDVILPCMSPLISPRSLYSCPSRCLCIPVSSSHTSVKERGSFGTETPSSQTCSTTPSRDL